MDHSCGQPDTTTGAAVDVHGRRVLGLMTEIVTLWSSPVFQQDLFGSGDVDGRGPTRDLQSSRVLYRLSIDGPSTPSRLSAELGTTRSNMSKVCGRLEAAGLVTRERDHRDGRAVAVALTPSGTEAAGRLLATADRMIATVLADWPVDDQAQLARLLEALVAGANAHAEDLGRGRP